MHTRTIRLLIKSKNIFFGSFDVLYFCSTQKKKLIVLAKIRNEATLEYSVLFFIRRSVIGQQKSPHNYVTQCKMAYDTNLSRDL